MSKNTSNELVSLAHFTRKYKAAGGNINELGKISDLTAFRIVEVVNINEHVAIAGKIPTIREEFSRQTSNILVNYCGDVSLREIARLTEQQLLLINNVGPTRLREIKRVLHDYGLRLTEVHN